MPGRLTDQTTRKRSRCVRGFLTLPLHCPTLPPAPCSAFLDIFYPTTRSFLQPATDTGGQSDRFWKRMSFRSGLWVVFDRGVLRLSCVHCLWTVLNHDSNLELRERVSLSLTGVAYGPGALISIHLADRPVHNSCCRAAGERVK